MVENINGTPHLLGYARVSGPKQDREAQIEALTDAGCYRIWEEQASTRKTMPEREKMLAEARPGDIVIVTKLDRLGRSLSDVVAVVERLGKREVELRTLNGMVIDTTTPYGRALFGMAAVFAELERDLITERTQEGRRRAIDAGKVMGRPPKVTPDDLDVARRLVASGMPVSDAAARVGVHPSTLTRHGIRALEAV